MKRSLKKTTKWLCTALLFTLHSSLFTSCSDQWNEHYESTSQAEAKGSLWTAISENSNLSNFARVAKVCGYDRILSGNQTYTVFAPTNAHFTDAEADVLVASYNEQVAKGVEDKNNTVVLRFLQNHIAMYRHPVSSMTNDTISMMNHKYMPLTFDGIYGKLFTMKNSLCANGLLFTMDEKLDYIANVFESLDIEEGLDSVYAFLNSHSIYEFSESESVPGEIIDGVTHYLDSVTHLRNDLLERFGYISSEDSSYIMVAPVNSEWERLVNEYAPYFVYAKNIEGADSMAYTNTRLAILGGSIFSRNTNKALPDSAVSTQAYSYQIRQMMGMDESYYIFQKPYGEGGIFNGTKNITCSNGQTLKATSFAIPKTKTFLQAVRVEAENHIDTILNANSIVRTPQVVSNNPFYGQVSDNCFIVARPDKDDSKVIVGFRVPRLLASAKYNVYAVFAPATAADIRDVEETTKPLTVVSGISQTDKNGKMVQARLRNPKTVDCTKVDTLLLQSNVTINTCGYDLSTPNVRLDIQSNTPGATLRIDCIKFVPTE